MPLCLRCEKSIKPASLAVTVGGEPHHPTCIYCDVCDKALWGQPFKRTKDGKLICEEPCTPGQKASAARQSSASRRPPSASMRNAGQMRPPSAAAMQPPPPMVDSNGYDPSRSYPSDRKVNSFSKPDSLKSSFDYLDVLNHQMDALVSSSSSSFNQSSSNDVYLNDLNRLYSNLTVAPTSSYAPHAPQISKEPSSAYYSNYNKLCKMCSKSVFSKRFITYENGDIYCDDCDRVLVSNNRQPPRITSAHMFTCSMCNDTLRGGRYYTEANGKTVCEKCSTQPGRPSPFANGASPCANCKQMFKPNAFFRTLPNGMKFHDYCFYCSNCNKLIGTNEFFVSNDTKIPHLSGLPICTDCHQATTNSPNAPTCYSCSLPITGTFLMLDNKRPIHNECFRCSQCNLRLDKDAGYFKNPFNPNLPICSGCNTSSKSASSMSRLASSNKRSSVASSSSSAAASSSSNHPMRVSRCARCSNTIEQDGVTFADKDYHQHCFSCDNCQTDLTKMKKTLTDKSGNGLYCEPCFVQNFAPKCSKCGDPVPPHLPGTKYEDKIFHKECFACARCKRSLADKKFFKSGSILICQNCY